VTVGATVLQGGGDSSGAGGSVCLGGGDGSQGVEVMARRAAKKTKMGGKDTTTSVTVSPVSARNHGSSSNIDDILLGDECTGTGVSKAKDVSESEFNKISASPDPGERCIVPSSTSAGVVANVPRRHESVVPINKAKRRGFIDYNTVHEQTPISAENEHFVDTISAFAVFLGVSFLIICYANAIHLTVANVLEGLLLIGQTLTLKHKRMLATKLNANAGDKMDKLTPNSLMNGTASPAPIFCSVLSSPPLCQSNYFFYFFVLNSTAWSARRHYGGTMAMLVLIVIALPGTDPVVTELTVLTLQGGVITNLAAASNPYHGSTSGSPNDISLCGHGPEQGFSCILAPGHGIAIGQTSSSFDSMHTLRHGGTYPGEVLVNCVDAADESPIEFLNDGVEDVTVYFIVDASRSGGAGAFTLEWLFYTVGKDHQTKVMINLWTEPRPRQGRVLNTYTLLTDSNIKTAAQLWASNPASATSTYGPVLLWDLSQVTRLENVWCGWDAALCGSGSGSGSGSD
jgi:hypothetical protein